MLKTEQKLQKPGLSGARFLPRAYYENFEKWWNKNNEEKKKKHESSHEHYGIKSDPANDADANKRILDGDTRESDRQELENIKAKKRNRDNKDGK